MKAKMQQSLPLKKQPKILKTVTLVKKHKIIGRIKENTNSSRNRRRYGLEKWENIANKITRQTLRCTVQALICKWEVAISELSEEIAAILVTWRRNHKKWINQWRFCRPSQLCQKLWLWQNPMRIASEERETTDLRDSGLYHVKNRKIDESDQIYSRVWEQTRENWWYYWWM